MLERGLVKDASVVLGLLFFLAVGVPLRAADKPKATLVVVPADDAADVQAAYVYRTLRTNLVRSKAFQFVDADDSIGARSQFLLAVDKARALFEDGKRNYDNLELKVAIRLFQQALSTLEAELGDLTEKELYGEVLTYLGSSFVLHGDQAQGKKLFRKLLIYNPKAELNPMVFPPALTALFKVVGEELQRAGTGALDVRPAPPGTEVWVDSSLRGVGPRRVDSLIEGEHVVRLVRRGYRSVGFKREVLESGEEVLSQELKPLPGQEAMAALEAQLLSEARESSFPSAAETLMQRTGTQRLFAVRVSLNDGSVELRAFHFDGAARSCLKAMENSFDPKDASYANRLGHFFAGLYLDLGERTLQASGGSGTSVTGGADAGTGGTGQGVGGEEPDPEPSRRWWTTWWFWTVTGAVVVGATGLALGLTLGGDGGPTHGEVVFRF